MVSRILLPLTLLAAISSAVAFSDENTWTLGNDRIEAVFRLTSAGLVLDNLTDPVTGSRLTIGAPDSTATINGTQAALGAAAAGWVLDGVATEDTDTERRLVFTFRSQRAPILAIRSYACYTGSPAIETWTTFRATTGAVTLTNLDVWQATVPGATIDYEFGLRGDAAGQAVDDSFSLQRASLAAGEQLTLREQNRSTEQYLPMIGADLAGREFFGGLMWSGSWQIQAVGAGDGQSRITAGLPGISFSIDAAHPLETPHGFFGVTAGGRREISAALHAFVMNGIRGGRPLQPVVTYNTWFSYGVDYDEEQLIDEMTAAASVGVELFVVDAGWWSGAGSGSDYTSGLGTWQQDARRFPDGLGALRDYAHELGMQFGIWVEPERVALSTVGRTQQAQQAWLASNNGNVGSPTAGQICLASPAARQWVLDNLFAFLDEVRPDYLKWDNNLWVNCNRTGHGHGTSDGNFTHVKALYDVLAALRERYPDMRIENCSQGGNRADFGMLRYTDTAWMDDRTSPAVHVRHNLQGLMTFFPPAYLLSFVLNDSEPIADSPDLPLFLRSRMPGILGLTYRAAELTETDRDNLAGEIALFKRLREITRDASGTLLTDQASPENGPAWDVVQEIRADTAEGVIFAFQNDGAVPGVLVQPRGLEPATIYVVQTVEGESLGMASGAALMTDGFDVRESSASAARTVKLTPIARSQTGERAQRVSLAGGGPGAKPRANKSGEASRTGR
jgi:alpha-galactosidase